MSTFRGLFKRSLCPVRPSLVQMYPVKSKTDPWPVFARRENSRRRPRRSRGSRGPRNERFNFGLGPLCVCTHSNANKSKTSKREGWRWTVEG